MYDQDKIDRGNRNFSSISHYGNEIENNVLLKLHYALIKFMNKKEEIQKNYSEKSRIELMKNNQSSDTAQKIFTDLRKELEAISIPSTSCTK